MHKIRDAIVSQKGERDVMLSKKYVPRNGLEESRRLVGSDLVKVITGPRRAGKSVYSLLMHEGVEYAYANFDDERLSGVEDYDLVLSALREVYGDVKYFLFDEIQNLEKWELLANRLQRAGYRITVTGSSSALMSRELATHLTGRTAEISVFPFSFREYVTAKGGESGKDSAAILGLLRDYLSSGGFPEVSAAGPVPANYAYALFDSVLFKDVVRRYGVRYSSALSDLAYCMATNPGMEYTYNSLARLVSMKSVHTVENYVRYLSEAYLFLEVRRFSHKAKEQIKAPRKTYAIDNGYVRNPGSSSSGMGRLMENVVATELLRRGKTFFYYRTQNQKEVDYAVKGLGGVEQLIQVCYESSDNRTAAREEDALVKAAGEQNCEDLLILTWDREERKRSGDTQIRYAPLWKWLLGKDAGPMQ